MPKNSPQPVEFRVAERVTLRGDCWGSGPPVVLLHGGGQTRWAWKSTAHMLAEAGFSAYAIDQRGHGESDWAPNGEYTFTEYADDVSAVLDQIGSPSALVGASLGGIASMVAESREPRASSLVLVDITHRMQQTGVEKIFAFMSAAPDGFADLEDAADAIAKYLPHRPRPKDLDGLRKNLRQHEDGRWRWHWDPKFIDMTASPDAPPKAEGSAVVNGEDLFAHAQRLTLPTLLVRGRMSDLITEEDAKAFCELVPHAEFTDVSGAGHMVAGDKNDAFASAIINFLTK